MALGGSSVRLSLVGVTGTTAEIIYTIDTTGRYEDGYLIVFNENNAEVSRTSSFRAYGNSSGSQNVTGITSGHLYTVKFYSTDLGVYSESTVEIDLRSGNPAYAVSSSSTATSIGIILSPLSGGTMGQDGVVTVEDYNTGEVMGEAKYKSSDSEASVMLVGLEQDTAYQLLVNYYDPGYPGSISKGVVISTSEMGEKQGPSLYGGVSGEAKEITKLYGAPALGKNLSPPITKYTRTGINGSATITASGDTMTVAAAAGGAGPWYRATAANMAVCPYLFQAGNMISFDVVATSSGRIEIGFEGGSWLKYYDIGTTTTRVWVPTQDGGTFHIYSVGGGVTFTVSNFQVEHGSTATAYEAFEGGETVLLDKLYGPGDKTVFDDFQLKGDTYQQTYSGKNKLGVSDGSGSVGSKFTWSAQDGLITLNGGDGSGSGAVAVLSSTLFNLSAGTRHLTIVSTGGTWSGVIGIRVVKTGGAQIGYQQWYSGSASTNATLEYTEEMASEAVSFQLYVGNNAVFNNHKFYVMWTEGSVNDFDYEPYTGGTASPNPDYPQAIQTVTGEQTVSVTGKNIFSGQYSQFDNTGGTGSTYAYFKLPDDGVYQLTLIAKNAVTGNDHTYLGFTSTGGNTTDPRAWAWQDHKTANAGDIITKSNIVSDTNLRYVSLYGKSADTLTWFTDNFDIMLEKAETATTYEPYQGSETYTIDLGSIELCKIGDYQDYIYKSGDDWYVHKATGSETLLSTRDWRVRTDVGYADGWTVFRDHDYVSGVFNTNAQGFSNYFRVLTTNIYEAGGIRLVDSSTWGVTPALLNSTLGITSSDSSDSKATKFKTWLSNHSVSLYYALATPTDTQITDTTLIGQLEALRRGALGDGSSVEVEGNLPVIISYDTIAGEAKLIHVSRPDKVYGYVTYYTDVNHTTTTTEPLRSQTEVNSLAGNSGNWSATVNGETVANSDIVGVVLGPTVSTIPDWFLASCDNLTSLEMDQSSVTSIPNRFMAGCTSVTDGASVTLPASLTSIGDYFMYGCTGLTSAPAFPSSLTTIGRTFMNDCMNMAIVVLPASLTSIGQEMLSVCNNLESVYVGSLSANIAAADSSGTYSFSVLTSGVPAYTNGIKILGDSSVINGWITKFPNRTSTPFRKLISG